LKRLGVELDPITLFRSSGNGDMPDPAHAVALIELAGTDSVVYTAHENPGEEEIRDLKILGECIHTHFHLRIPATEMAVKRCLDFRPEMITLIGKEKALDAAANEASVLGLVEMLRKHGIVACALIEPTGDQIKAAVKLGLDYIELHTKRYALADNMNAFEHELENLKVMAMTAKKFNLGVMASGRLNYSNVAAVAAIEAVEEVNIGHAIWSRALFKGVDQAVKDILHLIKKS